MAQCLPTTMDNPNNPFTHPDEWYEFDKEKGYMTREWLASLANTSSHLDEDEYNEEVSDAIDRLLVLNPFGIHFKVYDYEADTLIPLANKAFELMLDELKRTDEGDSEKTNPVSK